MSDFIDKRDQDGNGLAGMLHGISLTGYLQLLDWSSRLVRPGKARLADDAPPLLSRLRIEAAGWQAALQKPLSDSKRVGSYFGGAGRLRELADQQGRRFLKNITGRGAALTAPEVGKSQLCSIRRHRKFSNRERQLAVRALSRIDPVGQHWLNRDDKPCSMLAAKQSNCRSIFQFFRAAFITCLSFLLERRQ